MVEQLTRNEQVTGSSPVNGSMNSQRPAFQRAFCFRLFYGSAILESLRPVRVSKEQCSSKVPCSVFCFAGSEDALIGCISDCLAPFVLWDRLDWFSRFASPPLSLLRSFEIQVPGRIFEPRVANLPFETLSGSNFANLVEMMPGQKLTVCKRPGQIGAEICPRRFVFCFVSGNASLGTIFLPASAKFRENATLARYILPAGEKDVRLESGHSLQIPACALGLGSFLRSSAWRRFALRTTPAFGATGVPSQRSGAIGVSFRRSANFFFAALEPSRFAPVSGVLRNSRSVRSSFMFQASILRYVSGLLKNRVEVRI